MSPKPATDLIEVLKKLEDRSAQDAATQTLLSELSPALADILEHQEKSGPAMTEAVTAALSESLSAALRGLRVESNPQVHVAPPERRDCDIKFQWEGNRIVGARVSYDDPSA